MRAVLSWIDRIQEPERGSEVSVNDLAYKPDGSELLVACGTRILVYDGADGTMVQALRGHKDTVYCVAYAHNGERFASGSADKSVIVWTEQHEGILKYNHNDAIQRLAFCPTTSLLVSCAAIDFGLWSLDQKSVNKQKIVSRICSCAWTKDGNTFALGLFNGTISIRNKAGEEKLKIDRPGGAPIWTLCFNPHKMEDLNASSEGFEISEHCLAVADWTPSLSFYGLNGNQINKEKPLKFDPCSLDYFAVGDFLVMGGSDKQVALHTKDGVRLGLICEMQSWVWVCKTKPGTQFVAVGCQDGTVACYQLTFSTVHGLHKDRYAYRENMTDVVVQHLLTDKIVRIKCRDLVKKVAIHRNKLAVQLSDRVVIYQLASDKEDEMNYKASDRIMQNFECSLLVVCAKHIILCQEKKLQCYDFRGLKEHEWLLEALIRYIKVIGGPPGREGLLVGLKNGEVLKIFVHNPFPVELLKIKSAVRCLDLSLKRCKLAVVDEHSTCLVYDIKSKDLLFQEPYANSVAWNTHNEDLLCFSGNGMLSVKAKDFPLYQQRMQGFVVGFSGSRVFCLHMYTMSTVEVPLSNQLYQYLERGDYRDAYLIACLGVTESDWELLALEAIERLDMTTAKKAFIRTRNLRFLELLHRVDENRRRGETDNQLFLAEVNAFQGKLTEAASLFVQSGNDQIAIDMYTDLKMFEKAQELLSSASADTQKSLIRKRADWARSVNEPKTAAEMYISAGDYDKAVTIISEHGWIDMLINLARKVDTSHPDILSRIAKELSKGKEYTLAGEIYQRMGDTKALVQMHISAEQWEDAFAIAEKQPEFRDEVYVPYAHWLAEHDRFEEAQRAFHKAGRQNEALQVLEQLTENAVSETRFNDAGYYYWMLSVQYLDRAKEVVEKEREYVDKFRQYQKLAEIYYAFHAVHRYTDEPFTSYQAEALLNMSKFLLHAIGNEVPPGISKTAILYTLAKQGKALGAFKLARHAYEKLQQLRVPVRFQQLVETGALQIRSKPFHDSEELMPMCYRCSSTNPMLNNLGNICTHCKTPFVFSFVSFEILPVVEFQIEDGMTDQEAKDLIDAEPPLATEKGGKTTDPLKEKLTAEVSKSVASALIVNRAALMSMNRTEVIICEWPKPLKIQYFKNIIPEISITKCPSCNRLFHTDDYELAVLQEGYCPFCHKESGRSKKPIDEDDQEDIDEHMKY